MMKPVFRYREVGSTGNIDGLIEDFMIDIEIDEYAEPLYENFRMLTVWWDYLRAKLRMSKRFKYWKRVIEWEPDGPARDKILKSIG